MRRFGEDFRVTGYESKKRNKSEKGRRWKSQEKRRKKFHHISANMGA
jgi:hypothetical protein